MHKVTHYYIFVQSVPVIQSLPFSVCLNVMVFVLHKGFRKYLSIIKAIHFADVSECMAEW